MTSDKCESSEWSRRPSRSDSKLPSRTVEVALPPTALKILHTQTDLEALRWGTTRACVRGLRTTKLTIRRVRAYEVLRATMLAMRGHSPIKMYVYVHVDRKQRNHLLQILLTRLASDARV